MSDALHADTLYHSITPADFRFARRGARYLADQGLTPREVRDALIEELDLPARIAESIVYPLITGAPAAPAPERAAEGLSRSMVRTGRSRAVRRLRVCFNGRSRRIGTALKGVTNLLGGAQDPAAAPVPPSKGPRLQW